GAIAAGFRLLLKRLGASSRDVSAIYLAGAFGNYVQINSAIRIGLLEAPHSVIHAAGNTALRGARMLLLTGSEPDLPPIEHVSLAADPGFQDEFAICMAFPEYDKIRMEIRS
ncbi:MAG: ASKHA domain-containing protein, partial [Terracidiphilus sp.]